MTGPETENRFPPLQVPEGFKATLFACDPLVEYPSAVALGPRAGSIFVAADYMTGLGTEIVRRSEIRLLEDADGDGYADRATVFAEGFNSIQGLTFHGGALYAMHAPLLTALGDTNGDAIADERRDLVAGLGLPPEENPVRLHCANGLAMGHDGWLYLALGDHGCDVARPEGDRLVLEGGGILRCRPDGRDLHVFATGLRNIYDVALDDDLNVFVRDNENDGGDYKIRVCHSFFAADHGYPYLYYERPEEALPPLADLGLGSSAGGLVYRERQFPTEYHGNLFFCEWGKSVVRYHPQRAGGGFAPLEEIEFATGAENDPYGFKPTDLVVERDGSLIVADWADGQQPKRGRGRIYRITWIAGEPPGNEPAPQSTGQADNWIPELDSESYSRRIDAQEAIERRGGEGLAMLREALEEGRLGPRGRLHAIWILAHLGGSVAIEELFQMAASDPEPRVQAQAVRALANLGDPVLAQHRLDAGRGDTQLAARLADLSQGKDPSVLLEVTIALGRLRWAAAPDWLQKTLLNPGPALSHAAMQTLRRSENWPAVLACLDSADSESLRPIALRAVAGQSATELVDGMIERLRAEPAPRRRVEYADVLARVYKKPGPWVYWGYRPPPRAPNTVAWERTEAIEQALDGVLADPDRSVRLAVLRRSQREKIPARLDRLATWLGEEEDAEALSALLEALGGHPADNTRELLGGLVRDRQKPAAGRLAALATYSDGLNETSQSQLVPLAASLEDGPLLAEVLRQLASRPGVDASALLLARLESPEPAVRAAAIDALAVRHVPDAAEPLTQLLADPDAAVRRAAASAAGRLGIHTTCETLLHLAGDADLAVRRASLESLGRLDEPRAVPLAVDALADPQTRGAALSCIACLGGPAQAGAVVDLARRDFSVEVFLPVMRMLSEWQQHPAGDATELEAIMADLQGASGTLARWHVAGPLPAQQAVRMAETWASRPRDSGTPATTTGGDELHWQTLFGSGTDARVRLGLHPVAENQTNAADAAWLAYSELGVPDRRDVQFLAGSSGAVRIWLNGNPVWQRHQNPQFSSESDQFAAVLEEGRNLVLVCIRAATETPEFRLQLYRKSSTAEHATLVQAALTQAGDAEHGRKLFLDAEKTRCIQCHRIGDQGERIGPDMTGVGGRFSRIHLVESVLDPSHTIAPGYQPVLLILSDGRSLTGVRLSETDERLILADTQGKQHIVSKSDIEAQQPQSTSVMPAGLEKSLSPAEFVDLIAFLAAQHEG